MDFLQIIQYPPRLFLDKIEVLHKFLYTVKISSPVILKMWENKYHIIDQGHPIT